MDNDSHGAVFWHPGLSPVDRAYFRPLARFVPVDFRDLRAMALRLSYCPYRLEFKHPFGTAHGVRTGTDSIFIKLEGDGVIGYGEVTLPPYLKEKPAEVIQHLERIGASGPITPESLQAQLDDPTWFGLDAPGCRAGLQMALSDWIARNKQITLNELLDTRNLKQSLTIVTLGITPEAELAAKLAELPDSDALKLKVKDESAVGIIQIIRNIDKRLIFLDANQGLHSVETALSLAQAAGDRLLGFEQPFPAAEKAMQDELQEQLQVAVYGDESIQNLIELENSVGRFKGVNIKLMKCGGLDLAKVMAERAVELGLKVMLGSMSESSLGCTAMAHLSGYADILDLDGPILIKNDPFEGMAMKHGKLVMPDQPGIGAVLKAELQFTPVCT